MRDLGWFEIKAFPAPVRIFELRGRGERRSRIDSARARGFARFVGRKRELERLEGALEKVVLGEGQIVQVVGEAGIGKSRLCHEFLESCRERGLRTGDWQVLSHLPTTPLLGFVEFLRSRLGIPPTDPPAVVREKLSRLGGGEVPWIEDFSRLIADMLSVPEDAHETGVGGPSRPIVDVGRLVEDLALAAGRLGPWVIVLEDVHWLTSEAAAILHGILAIVPRTRAMLLLTVRTEGSTPAWLGSVGETLHLGPLDVVDANGIVRDLLGEDPSIAPLSGRILERSAGNAFYIGELVQSLVECGAIVGEKGAYRLGRLEGAIALPATVEALLGARIDRLQGREKSVLRAAAVIGPEFARRILERSLGADEEEIGRALEALTAAEFVERRDDPGEERYRFRHPLLHEAAYGSQLEASRAPLHAAVAAALAEGEPGELDERAAVIADHLMRGGERLAAARWGSRAARWITTRNVTEALKAWERVASLLDHVEPTEESRRLWLEATINLLELGSRVGIGRERAARLFEGGDEIAAGLGDDRGRARLHGAYAQLRAMKGDPHGTIDLTRRAIVMARRSGDEHLVADLRIALVFGYLTAGRFREVRALAEEVLQPWPLPRGGSRGRIERAMGGYVVLFHGMAIL